MRQVSSLWAQAECLSKETGIKHTTLYQRMRKGISGDALLAPPMTHETMGRVQGRRNSKNPRHPWS